MRNTPKNLYKKLLGASGERAAAKYLKQQGCKILEQNYKTPFGEADLIVKDKCNLVFVEVKTRTSQAFGRPCEAVGYKKQQKYFAIAAHYLDVCSLNDTSVRFDIIEIENGQITHIIDAFYQTNT